MQNAFSKVPCDMAVIPGDLMHGHDYKDGKKQYIKDLRSALEVINSIPFAFVFGNHDDEWHQRPTVRLLDAETLETKIIKV